MPISVRRLKEIERWRLFLKEYLRLESEFLTLTEYIPLAGRKNAANFRFGSPRAASFGMECCGWIETCFRALLRNTRFDGEASVVKARKANQSVVLYRKVFERLLSLSQEERLTIDKTLSVVPFEAFGVGKTPDWFKRYSKLKHDRVELAAQWTMRDALDSLAALSVVLKSFVQPGVVLGIQSSVFLGLLLPHELVTMSEMTS